MLRMRWLPVLFGIILIAAGVFSIFSPVETSAFIPSLIGVSLIVDGIGKLIKWSDEKRFYGQSRYGLAGGIVSTLFGLFLLFSPALRLTMGAAVIMVLGGWIASMGALRIVQSLRLRKMSDYIDPFGYPAGNRWYLTCIPGILQLMFGVLNILYPAVGLAMVGTLIGIILIAAGGSLLSFGRLAWMW